MLYLPRCGREPGSCLGDRVEERRQRRRAILGRSLGRGSGDGFPRRLPVERDDERPVNASLTRRKPRPKRTRHPHDKRASCSARRPGPPRSTKQALRGPRSRPSAIHEARAPRSAKRLRRSARTTCRIRKAALQDPQSRPCRIRRADLPGSARRGLAGSAKQGPRRIREAGTAMRGTLHGTAGRVPDPAARRLTTALRGARRSPAVRR